MTESLESIHMAGKCKMEKEMSLRSFLKKTQSEEQKPEYSGRSNNWKKNTDEPL